MVQEYTGRCLYISLIYKLKFGLCCESEEFSPGNFGAQVILNLTTSEDTIVIIPIVRMGATNPNRSAINQGHATI